MNAISTAGLGISIINRTKRLEKIYHPVNPPPALGQAQLNLRLLRAV